MPRKVDVTLVRQLEVPYKVPVERPLAELLRRVLVPRAETEQVWCNVVHLLNQKRLEPLAPKHPVASQKEDVQVHTHA